MEVDGLTTRLLALRQPVARDLRLLTAALKITTDLERIGDYAANVAKRSIALNQAPPVKPVYAVPRMGRLCQAMIKDILDAYVERDAEKALAVWLRDEELDASGIADREFKRPGLDLCRHHGGLKRVEREHLARHVRDVRAQHGVEHAAEFDRHRL